MPHNYILKNKITSTVMEVKCTRCNKEFGINTSINALIELDDELINLHKTLKNDC